MCDATNHKPFDAVLTDVHEVRRRIVHILDNMIVFFYRWLCDILFLMLSFWFPPDF